MATANIDIRNLQVSGLIQTGQVIDLCNIHTDGVSDGYLVTHSGDAPLSLPSSLKGKVKAWSIGGKCVQDGTPTPSVPVAIDSIGTYDSESGKYEVVLEAMYAMPNKWNMNSATIAVPGFNASTKVISADGKLSATNNAGISACRFEPSFTAASLGLVNGKTYTIVVWSNDMSTTADSAITTNNVGLSYRPTSPTAPISTTWTQSGGNGVSMLIYFNTYAIGTVSSIWVMVVEGSVVPTTYIPYGTSTSIASVSALIASPLRGIGNVTDLMDNTGAVTHRFGVVDLGSLSWFGGTNNIFYSQMMPTAKGVQTSVVPNALCTAYQVIKFQSEGVDKALCYNADATPRFRIKDTAYTDAASFKTAMSGVMLVYELATPTTETATISGSLKTTKGTTILDVDGSVKGNVEATYLASQPMYKELQYLQSTGTQYIDLGLTASANMEWMHKVRMPSTTSSNVTFGSGESSKYLYALYLYTGGLIDNIGTSYNPTYDVSSAPYLNKDVTEHMTIANGAYTGIVECDGNTITKTGTYTTSAIPTTNGMYMFCTHHRDGSAKYNLNGRYYYLKIWKDGTLVRDLIPVRRTTDNVLGMLDKVSGQLFTNKGTGTFYSNENPPLLGLGAPLMGAMPSDEEFNEEDM